MQPAAGAWRSDLTLRLARWSLYSIIAVVLMFGATLAYAQLVIEPIEDETDALANDSLPSIKELALARDALARIQTALHTEGPTKKSDLERARRDLDAALSAYQTLPQFPGEHDLYVAVDGSVAVLEEHLDDARASNGPSPQTIAPLAQAADAAIHRAELFNMDHGSDAANRIAALKRRSRAISIALAAVSLFLTVFASWLVIRAARKQIVLARDHEALLMERGRELEAFAGRIAHDLKDPLGTLALRLALMKQHDEANPAERDEQIDKAVRQVERMDHLIEGVLAFARAGENPPPDARAQLRDAVDEVIAQTRPKADAVHAELRVDPVPSSVLACTPGALLSVLSNLVGNAIKYVGEGRSSVRQVVVHVEDHERSVRIEVADTGPGLPADAGGRVFQPIARTDASASGLGLGLATVKRIVEGFGGRLGVRSALGRGSTFWFEVPKAGGAT